MQLCLESSLQTGCPLPDWCVMLRNTAIESSGQVHNDWLYETGSPASTDMTDSHQSFLTGVSMSSP